MVTGEKFSSLLGSPVLNVELADFLPFPKTFFSLVYETSLLLKEGFSPQDLRSILQLRQNSAAGLSQRLSHPSSPTSVSQAPKGHSPLGTIIKQFNLLKHRLPYIVLSGSGAVKTDKVSTPLLSVSHMGGPYICSPAISCTQSTFQMITYLIVMGNAANSLYK